MTRSSVCLKCGASIRAPKTGRPPSYCSPSCRRAAELELRRVQAELTAADRQLVQWRQAVAGIDWSGQPAAAQVRLDWWVAEHARLEERLRALLGAAPSSPTSGRRGEVPE